MNQTLAINHIGRQGDGIAETPQGPVFVPFTLPGETVTVSGIAEKLLLEHVEQPSSDRQDPVCRHFGICGGCQLQHYSKAPYLQWKQGLVADALAREGIDTPLQPILAFGAHLRRRVVFTAIRGPTGSLLGFSQRGSNKITDLSQCPVMLPQIEAALDAFRQLGALLSPKKGAMKLSVVACENGLDVAAANGTITPEPSRQQAISIAVQHGFARLSLNGETMIELSRPIINCGRAKVTPPPETFVQAVAGAEDAMAALVTGHLEPAKSVVDLFSGFGAFALRLAENSTVLAVESNGAALAALEKAWRDTGGGLKATTTLKRDLYRNPLVADELKKTGGVVFDPPRAGALEQVQELAKSKVPLIAAVSCNPVSLARDLRVLIDGGYKLQSVTPLDQFVFTPHVEAVALLSR